MVEIFILTVIIALLAAMAVPNILKARDRAMRDLCIYNLGQIESAKGAWAFGHGANNSAELEPEDLSPFFSSGLFPACPAGGEYEIGILNEPPFCTLEDLDHIHTPAGTGGTSLPGQISSGEKPGHGQGPPSWAKPTGRNGRRS
jgi:hypothetical protein